jgi:L-alanine-DL-glutamate epimerase-like enolase superfamily enzyme
VFRNYRRWAFESAALDLALRQAGRSLAEALGREPQPVTFVVSSRMGEPPTIEPVTHRLARYPDLRFKLDGTPDWDDDLIAGLIATGAVDSIDFKGAYKGTPVDVETDPAFYRRIAEAFPDAWLEDPDLELPAAREALEPFEDRITWDAPIHSVDDILAAPVLPRTVNLKPSRFGSVRALFDGYDFCAERGMGAYGGGQYELGPGRGQIQYLASIFHPDGPNDVAPGGYNDVEPPAGLATSPLAVAASATGFGWG